MLIRKRTGQEVEFSKHKIRKAINSANEQASPINKITENDDVTVVEAKRKAQKKSLPCSGPQAKLKQ